MKPKIEIFDSKEELSREFGNMIVNLCKERETVNIALSGGNTPKAIFDLISVEYKNLIDWNKIRLFWVDERCVATTHPESNYGMTLNHLLSKVPVPKDNIFRMEAENEPLKAALDYSDILKSKLPQRNNLPYTDITLLGLGDDGHTASIFPHEMYLWNSHNLCEIANHPQTGQKRITLTGSIINNSAQIVFIVTGKQKSFKTLEILKKTGGYMNYPASLVKRSRSIWLIDREAAEKL